MCIVLSRAFLQILFGDMTSDMSLSIIMVVNRMTKTMLVKVTVIMRNMEAVKAVINNYVWTDADLYKESKMVLTTDGKVL